MTERAPYRPTEGSRVWGYVLPLLLVPILLSILVLWLGPWAMLGGVVTLAAIGIVWLLARRGRTA